MIDNRKYSKISIISLCIISVLIALSCFTLTAFAQNTINSKKDIIETESQPPENINMREGTVGIQNTDNTENSVYKKSTSTKLTDSQAQPFIDAAKAYSKTVNTTIPESGYKCISEYFSEKKRVLLTWVPDNWSDEIIPLADTSFNIYSIVFKNVDLNDTSDLQSKIDNGISVSNTKLYKNSNIKITFTRNEDNIPLIILEDLDEEE